jgi:hypothetical protein
MGIMLPEIAVEAAAASPAIAEAVAEVEASTPLLGPLLAQFVALRAVAGETFDFLLKEVVQPTVEQIVLNDLVNTEEMLINPQKMRVHIQEGVGQGLARHFRGRGHKATYGNGTVRVWQ